MRQSRKTHPTSLLQLEDYDEAMKLKYRRSMSLPKL